MGWRAETDQKQLGPGAMLSIFMEPWGAGLPMHLLPSGANIVLRFPNGAETKIEVIEATASEVILQTFDGAKWWVVRTTRKGLPFPPADTTGAPATYWIVKERVVETAIRE
jgi:hypothetical protein